MWFKKDTPLEPLPPSEFLQMRPLPMNMPQFEAWSERIIQKANLPTEDMETQQFALAGMILQTSPSDFMRPDEYYVGCLRKAASDQLATQVIQDLREKRQARLEAAKRLSAVTPLQNGVTYGVKEPS